MHLPSFLAEHFPGLAIAPPLFYSWPIALRFELNSDTTLPDVQGRRGQAYWDGVQRRAQTLYEACFQPGEHAILVSQAAVSRKMRSRHTTWRRASWRSSPKDIFRLSHHLDLGIPGIAGRHQQITDRDGEEALFVTLRWTAIDARKIRYDLILQTLANDRYSLNLPYVDEQVVFINVDRRIILHMYDDRGMDLIAPSREELQPIFDAHKAWLLPHDLARMQAMFSPVTAAK